MTQSAQQQKASTTTTAKRVSGERRQLRRVGALAITYAASLAIQNVLAAATGAPSYADNLADVLAFHATHRNAVAAAVGLEALNLPLLLAFLARLHMLVVRRRGGSGALASRLALAAGSTLSAAFMMYAAAWIGVVLYARTYTEASPALQLAWQMHAAAFALSMPALGTTFIGAAFAGHSSGLTPPWQRALGVAGGTLPILAGLASLAIADGSPLIFLGLPGMALWIVWLFATGLRLVRGRAVGPGVARSSLTDS